MPKDLESWKDAGHSIGFENVLDLTFLMFREKSHVPLPPFSLDNRSRGHPSFRNTNLWCLLFLYPTLQGSRGEAGVHSDPGQEPGLTRTPMATCVAFLCSFLVPFLSSQERLRNRVAHSILQSCLSGSVRALLWCACFITYSSKYLHLAVL